MDPLNEYFRNNPPSGAQGACASEAELFRLTQGISTPGEREKILEHAMNCAACTEKMALLKEFADAPPTEKNVPQDLVRRSLPKAPARFRMPVHGWLILFICFMALSFLWPRHFIQMLVIAAVFAGKWLIESRAQHLHVRITQRTQRDAADDSKPGAGRFDAHARDPKEAAGD